MGTMTVKEFSKNLKRALDKLESGGEEIIITKNNTKIARLIPGSPHMTAIEAMSDLYQTLPPEAAENWIEDSRINGIASNEVKDSWAS